MCNVSFFGCGANPPQTLQRNTDKATFQRDLTRDDIEHELGIELNIVISSASSKAKPGNHIG